MKRAFAAVLMASALLPPPLPIFAQPDAEARVIGYIRDHLRPGEPLLITELAKTFTEPDERKALDKLYNAFFRIPLFVVQYQSKFGKPPSLKTLTEQFDLKDVQSADVLLRVMESDPRVPRFLTRDPKTGEITSVDVEKIRSIPRFGQAVDYQLGGWEGKPAPDFTLSKIDGGDVSAKALRGKVTLLYVWFTGCPPCMKETPALVALNRGLSGRDFVIVSANADRILGLSYDDAVRHRYVEEQKINFPVTHWTRDADKAYGNISVFPTLFLINRGGTVTHHWIGFTSSEELRQAIDQELKPIGSAR